MVKSVSMRALGSRAAPHLTGFSETLPVKRVYPKTQTDRPVFFQVWLFLGGNRTPPGFSWFSLRKSLQNR